MSISVPLMTALFHIQQCAEKALKTYIVFKKGSVAKTHDLVHLIDICIEINKNFETLRLFASNINPYQTAGRYPEPDFIKPSIEEIKEITAQSEFILNFVIDRCYFYNLPMLPKKKRIKMTQEIHPKT